MAKRPPPSHDSFMAGCNTVARQRLLNRRITARLRRKLYRVVGKVPEAKAVRRKP